MAETARPDLSRIVEGAKKLALSEYGREVDGAEVEEVVRQVLYKPRDLLQAVAKGLVTQRETWRNNG